MTLAGIKKYKCVLVWMRRALRVQNNTALNAAIQDADIVIPVLCLSIDKKYQRESPRRRYVRSVIASLDSQLRLLGSQLVICQGEAAIELPLLARKLGANCIYAARVYDSIGLRRDESIRSHLNQEGRDFVTFKDRVLFEKDEILNQSGLPFRVYTPYKRAWLEKTNEIEPIPPPVRSLRSAKLDKQFDLSSVVGFKSVVLDYGEVVVQKELQSFIKRKISSYREKRDFPAVEGTSKLSAALSLGVISIRQAYWAAYQAKQIADRKGRENIDTFVSELIWREFYYQILANFPYVTERSFKDDLVDLQWSSNKRHFAAWCEGRTGYPIVDAGMRQLALEGWIHNRVRMIVASFLTKDLHISWQRGEQFFFEHLCDADIASNNGGWQWSAGTGTDAQPWFRIFNPVAQGQKFDPDGVYVRKYVPELAKVPARFIHSPWLLDKQEQAAYGVTIGRQYPHPIVTHATEREVTMRLYKRQPVDAKVFRPTQEQYKMF